MPGSLLSALRPLLTPAIPRRALLPAAPAVAGRPRLQVSLSKDVNSRCTTGPFISGAEHRTALCRASLSAPSTLYGLSVRRLISFDRWLPSHETSRFRSCFGLMFGPSCLSYERPDDRVPRRGVNPKRNFLHRRGSPLLAWGTFSVNRWRLMTADRKGFESGQGSPLA